jgi:hypothetical protein
LNKYESDYLNGVFKLENFNFENKMIKFRDGSWGHTATLKSHYFRQVKEWKRNNNGRIHEELLILSEVEKQKYGDYDALIITWSHFPLTERSRRKFLKNQLKRNK